MIDSEPAICRLLRTKQGPIKTSTHMWSKSWGQPWMSSASPHRKNWVLTKCKQVGTNAFCQLCVFLSALSSVCVVTLLSNGHCVSVRFRSIDGGRPLDTLNLVPNCLPHQKCVCYLILPLFCSVACNILMNLIKENVLFIQCQTTSWMLGIIWVVMKQLDGFIHYNLFFKVNKARLSFFFFFCSSKTFCHKGAVFSHECKTIPLFQFSCFRENKHVSFAKCTDIDIILE